MDRGRLDSVSIAGLAVFSSLAILLSAASQAMGLNFPVVPYLQFDFGELAVVMTFYIFGPAPAAASSFVEFVGLEAYGLNVPWGPALKLIALLSSVGGLWAGTIIAARARGSSVRKAVGIGALFGLAARVLVMTFANYYLLLFVYGLNPTVAYFNLAQAFSAMGLSITSSNALLLILALTGVFNALQLTMVVGLSYTVLKFPPVSNLKVGGRAPWFVLITNAAKPEGEAR